MGILGILKAGATYLPLDPSYPVNRLQLMLEDAQPPVLLTQSHLISRITSNQRLIISIKNSWKEKCSKYPKKLAPQLTINLKDLAYIIYTSGSVGQPKGIMVSHGSFLQTTAHKHHFQEGLIGLLLGAISFDVTILTIFYLLTTGGTICIPQAKTLAVLDSLIAFIKTQSINFILTVPSQYAKILEKSVPLHSLRIVSLAGESIPGHLPQLHAALAPQALLYNEYGPSEYAIGTTIAKIYDPANLQLNPITIGQPHSHTSVYILDDQLQECSTEEKGEIFVGGAGLAEGYLNQPLLTDQKFLLIALPGQQPKRLYRTGDLGRYLPDGNLEFLGRKEYQTKVCGMQVELGEIEHLICQYPTIKESIVIVVQKEKLLAFYTSTSSSTIQNELRKYLANRLPLFKLPSSYMQLENFPRTLNGKIERNPAVILASIRC